ncbi:MAG TPA: ATP-binding cassette domain-containing protein, partial [Acidimicrobiales bacterium]
MLLLPTVDRAYHGLHRISHPRGLPIPYSFATTLFVPHHGWVLSVRNLSVEVGGRLTLDEASFTVRAGDKVGLVGRNGAGKTSMLKVLGGEREPAGGVVHVHGGLGYLPQDPRPHGDGVDATALSHVMSGRGLDEAARRMEKLRLAVEEDPSDRAIARYTRAEERF